MSNSNSNLHWRRLNRPEYALQPPDVLGLSWGEQASCFSRMCCIYAGFTDVRHDLLTSQFCPLQLLDNPAQLLKLFNYFKFDQNIQRHEQSENAPSFQPIRRVCWKAHCNACESFCVNCFTSFLQKIALIKEAALSQIMWFAGSERQKPGDRHRDDRTS